ncbi:unnamed protein product [Zymoseptoria tritici ST99CH_1A5]|uniref:Uncharacterized protein n=2 Tax=Zymoseptoria tritici TaxID=1047171 RepID=A0A2H1FZI2_ZYMTR|nr:unnamed protein product [Zymoseptoria tritici ST99CH_1E4]SMR47966.1 unnamed protein product [Zymoseptoria tritici ST99CH_3D1]SMY21871.1 unnamed protein product [Zymoseptoria tritici ST99CH_1A5]
MIYGHVFNGVRVFPHPYDGNKNTVSQANAGVTLACRAMYVRHIKPYYERTIFHFDSEMQARGWQRMMATELQRQYEVGYDARMLVKTSSEDGTYYMYWKTLGHVPGIGGPDLCTICIVDEGAKIPRCR